MEPFAKETREFIDALSNTLLAEQIFKPHSELTTLGFWLRASNIKRLRQQYFAQDNVSSSLFLKPLGGVLHIAPSNVDTMFVYSWVCSLLVGNNNIVRVPSNITEAVQKLLSLISRLLQQPKFTSIAQRNLIATWTQQSNVSATLSLMVQARMIWGGNETVQNIRKMPTLPNCRDIAFADKFSVSVLKLAGKSQDEIDALAELLWRDISTFQQAACSSPRVLVFSDSPEQQKQHLYSRLMARANSLTNDASTSMNHLVARQLILSQHQDNYLHSDGPLSVVKIHKLHKDYIAWHPAQNFLYEYDVGDLTELFAWLPEQCQTVSHFGFSSDELQRAVAPYLGPSVDRLVPVGQALIFSSHWDGYDVLKQLSRIIELRV
ncbi:acyl-CoA reductase [Planctobacterium marinum]|uniref:Acyl-CoA reductase n=1 Tax=Planctobacterium marinum TaxID=1631968 RepID=A0AA48I895_9ALTE|nr:acyl-CoA reductase [Planctobacterium marinum]